MSSTDLSRARTQALRPTRAHRLLASLHASGRLHYLVSQNCDGLHLRSGFPARALTEVHGNVFREYCERCSREYVRPFAVDAASTSVAAGQAAWYERCRRCGWNHYTGRLCEAGACGGRLRDTIVNFGDALHDAVCGGYLRAEAECRRAALVLCLGSSLTVTPAAELPTLMQSRGAALAIVNLQPTCHDAAARVRLFYDLQDFAALLEEALAEEAQGRGGGGESGGGGGEGAGAPALGGKA